MEPSTFEHGAKREGEEGEVSAQPPPPRRHHQEHRPQEHRVPPPPYTAQPIVQAPGPAQHGPPNPGHITVIPSLGSSPRPMTCPSCRTQIITTVIYESSTKTHIVAGFICGVTLWCFICCVAAIPYYMKCCKVAEHYCPSCNYYIGGFSKL